MVEALDVRIRRVGDRDLEPITATVNHYIAHSTANFRTEPETVTEWKERWIEGRDRFPWLVAEVDGGYAGFVHAAPWSSRHAYAWTIETTIYLDPDARGRGVGRTVYNRLLDTLGQQGYRTAIATIGLPHPASVALHESCGFTPAGEIHNAGFKDDRWLSVGFWERSLGTDEGRPGPLLGVDDVWQD
jgi:phosphinothricin acetyltransferase